MLLWGNDVLGPGFWQAACGLERWNTEEKSLCFQMYASTSTQDINACMQMVLKCSKWKLSGSHYVSAVWRKMDRG